MSRPSYWLTRFLVLRLLGFVYLFAFLSLALQVLPLIGHEGLLPADHFLERVAAGEGSRWLGFWRLPSLFWFGISDRALVVLSWTGVALSLAVLLGFANGILLAVLWALYQSFVHVGQSVRLRLGDPAARDGSSRSSSSPRSTGPFSRRRCR